MIILHFEMNVLAFYQRGTRTLPRLGFTVHKNNANQCTHKGAQLKMINLNKEDD